MIETKLLANDAIFIPASDQLIEGRFINVEKETRQDQAGCSGHCQSGVCMTG